MSTNRPPCRTIYVHRWNARYVDVVCPYCEEIHHHGTELPGRRVSHCYPGGQYEFRYPIDEEIGLVGYEIDKRRACFVNIDLKKDLCDEDSEEDESELVDRFSSAMNISSTNRKSDIGLNLDKDARELVTIPLSDGETLELETTVIAISDCVSGNVHTISRYLSTSTETNLFLHGKDDSGNTTLIMAASEKSREMVSLLLQHGAHANAVNNAGRSALMEAALWGRIESVKALLDAHADKCLRDHEGHRAIDLAKAARKNEKERCRRSKKAAEESVAERDRDRRHIVLLLDDFNAGRQRAYTAPLSGSERNKYGFRISSYEMTITLHGPISSYPVPRISKTAAVLDRVGPFTRITATSGWGANSLPPKSKLGPDWIEQVCYIASEIGHQFQDAPDPGWDQGRHGRFYASHAEKKLIAYFMDKHVFMPQDKKPDKKLGDSILKGEAFLEKEKNSSIAWAEVRDLEERRDKLDRQLFNADDRQPGDAYDEQEVERLKQEIDTLNEKLLSLELDSDVAAMRAREKEKAMLLRKAERHQNLMELSEHEPPFSLKRAVILSSNQICEDCKTFVKKVNNWKQLNIEVHWCT
ncbi:hypothetical protein F5Y05DRAFT_338702 [Hypoxylon sp. FL0543]|nr:hypothetical protein F5Y05DRAFT_338702 [Hypoxylon sp. FL0543]